MTDSEYIQAVCSGNSNSFKPLVERYQQLVFRTAMGFLHQQEDAEDLTQEVFIKVYQSLHTFTGDAAFSTWLYKITVNHSLNYLRRKKRLEFFSYAEDLFQHLLNKGSEESSPHEKMEQDDYNNEIRNSIDSLTEKQRTAFILSRYEDLPQKEIARIMGISEGAVEQHLQRANKNLQKKLALLVGKK
jgi:RNA polymerase sigma-70 factor (ECF subfamily)